ncbi:MAG: enoyl-CoA hydratase/isomerase family protein [Parvularculaceae bacterium]
MTPTLFYRTNGDIGEIVLNQPVKRNAISAAMWAGLQEAATAAGADANASVIVIRGEGGHFAAGADIDEFEKVYATTESARAYTRVMLDALAAVEALPKPTLAAIRGACIGGGCSIALACDFRFAAETAKIGVTPGKLGLVYSVADTRRLVAAVGESHAKDLLLTGRLVDAGEAKAMGFANRVLPDNALDAEVAAFCRDLAGVSRWSTRATKEMLRLLKTGAADDDAEAAALLVSAFTHADFGEGYRAFLEKRKPSFPTR